MAITRLIGDIHGAFNDYRAYAVQDCERSIQIGDFGIGFGQSDYWHENVNRFHASGQHRFIRGNHDNPTVCKEDMVGCIPDGLVENDVMFIGGAWSIDNPDAPPGWYKRTAHVDWWPDEECSEKQFAHFLDIYSVVKPRVMITHDCPHNIAGEMFWGSGFLQGPRYNTRTGDFLQKLFEVHQPDEWYFGHWHNTMQYKSGRTMFQCIGILDYVDVDL